MMRRSFHGQELAGIIGLGLSLTLWLLSSWRLIYHTIWGRKQRQRQRPRQQRRGGGSSFLFMAATTSPESTPSRRRQQHQSEEVNTSPSLEEQKEEEGSEGSAPLMIREQQQGGQQQQYHHHQQQQRRRRIVSKWFTRRKTFHCLLWMATTSEALAYADLSGLLVLHHNRIFATKLGYILLDVVGRSILELLAFSTVTAIWVQTSINASIPLLLVSESSSSSAGRHSSNYYQRRRYRMLHHYLGPMFAILIFLLVLSSGAVSCIIFFSHEHDDLSTIQHLPLFKVQTILESISWGVHSIVVMECAIMTTKRITAVVPRTLYRKRISLLCKAVVPMVVTSILYFIRCGWLIAVYYCNNSTSNKVFGRGSWSWWIGFMWFPTWMTIIMLLYSARKRDQYHSPTTTIITPTSTNNNTTTGNNNNNNNTSLLLRQPLLPRPPAEAFLAFSHHRNITSEGEDDADLEDDSLFCSPIQRGTKSPMIVHVYTNNNDREGSTNNDIAGIVADEETLTTESITNNDYYHQHHHHHHHNSPRRKEEGLTITETETFDDDDYYDEALGALISEAKVCEDALAKEIQEFNEILEGSDGRSSNKTRSDVSGDDTNEKAGGSSDDFAETQSGYHNNKKGEGQQDNHHQVDLEEGRHTPSPTSSTTTAADEANANPTKVAATGTPSTNWVFYEAKGRNE